MDTEAILAAMVRDSAQRIAEADAEAHRAQVAFAAGKFQEYLDAKFKETEAKVQAEYDAIFGETSDH